MEILKMKVDSIEEYVEIHMDVFSKSPWNINEKKEDISEYFLKYFRMNSFLGYEFREGNRILGFSMGYKKPWIEGYEYFIDQFCIKRLEQNKGLGTKFLDIMEEELYEEEVVNITLMTDKYLMAYKFYKGVGFESLDEYRMLTKEI